SSEAIGASDSGLPSGVRVPGPVLAERAARATDELRRSLREWHAFYSGYDPVFTWWTKQPYEEAERTLESYSRHLREAFAGYRDGEEGDAPLIGDPIGREALVRAL